MLLVAHLKFCRTTQANTTEDSSCIALLFNSLQETTSNFSPYCFQCLNLLVLLLESLTDPEAKFRSLVALGTVIEGGAAASRSLAKSLDMRERVQTLKMVDQADKKVAETCAALIGSL